MRTALYVHGSVLVAAVADAIAALGAKVQQRNANYFNERETEQFDRVVVEDGKNADAIRVAYEAAGVSVLGIDEYLDFAAKEAKASTKQAKPEPAPTASAAKDPDAPAADPAKPETPAFNPDAPRSGKGKGPKAQGEAKAATKQAK